MSTIANYIVKTAASANLICDLFVQMSLAVTWLQSRHLLLTFVMGGGNTPRISSIRNLRKNIRAAFILLISEKSLQVYTSFVISFLSLLITFFSNLDM